MDRCLGNAKLKELKELALFVESNRESDKKICIGKNISDNQFTYTLGIVHCPFILKGLRYDTAVGPCSVTSWGVTGAFSKLFWGQISPETLLT